LDDSLKKYNEERIKFWDGIYFKNSRGNFFSNSYHKRLSEIINFIIPQGTSTDARVLETGCGTGDLLAKINSNNKTGIDFSSEAIKIAKSKYPDVKFIEGDVQSFDFSSRNEKFDYIILSDLVNDLYDIQKAFENIRPVCNDNTKLIINFYSRVWGWTLKLGEIAGLKKKNLEQNWITVTDIKGLLNLSGFEMIKSWHEILLPANIPLLNSFFNKFLVRIFPFNHLSLTNFVIGRSKPQAKKDYSVSIIVPARNEAGNIKNILDRTNKLGKETELIFVEGNSTDNTYQVIQKEIQTYDKLPVALIKQSGKGKGNAVREGFKIANGDILMILDADLTVPPEKLSNFYVALASGTGEFINGVRLVYPMDEKAMRFFNFMGNKFFSAAFSWLLGQPVKDTLCGTKVLFKSDYEKIAEQRSYFGNFDPFGDFDLIFGAAKLNLKMIDLPIRYKERTYGETNIQRWKHGWLLFKMVFFAARKIKFK
jgi:SAM-dependent methyltransferase